MKKSNYCESTCRLWTYRGCCYHRSDFVMTVLKNTGGCPRLPLVYKLEALYLIIYSRKGNISKNLKK